MRRIIETRRCRQRGQPIQPPRTSTCGGANRRIDFSDAIPARQRDRRRAFRRSEWTADPFVNIGQSDVDHLIVADVPCLRLLVLATWRKPVSHSEIATSEIWAKNEAKPSVGPAMSQLGRELIKRGGIAPRIHGFSLQMESAHRCRVRPSSVQHSLTKSRGRKRSGRL
jgi:hypothetical protein